MKNPEAKQYYFGGETKLRVYKRPISVKKQDLLQPDNQAIEPISRKINREVGQFTFACNVYDLKRRGLTNGVTFHIPKSEIDGADLPDIIMQDGTRMLNPRLGREIFDVAYAEARIDMDRDDAQQRAAIHARYGSRGPIAA